MFNNVWHWYIYHSSYWSAFLNFIYQYLYLILFILIRLSFVVNCVGSKYCLVYFIHDRMTWFHSLNNPKVNKSSKTIKTIEEKKDLTTFMQEKYGNKTINSTSKMINTNATKKKCNLNFTRKSLYVLNPHSKGLCNSRS